MSFLLTSKKYIDIQSEFDHHLTLLSDDVSLDQDSDEVDLEDGYHKDLINGFATLIHQLTRDLQSHLFPTHS